ESYPLVIHPKAGFTLKSIVCITWIQGWLILMMIELSVFIANQVLLDFNIVAVLFLWCGCPISLDFNIVAVLFLSFLFLYPVELLSRPNESNGTPGASIAISPGRSSGGSCSTHNESLSTAAPA
nr:hypothetical protein [Endozoicomonas sp.]